MVFDVDHDFEGLRAPKAHLDTVNRNLLDHLRRPFTLRDNETLNLFALVVNFGHGELVDLSFPGRKHVASFSCRMVRRLGPSVAAKTNIRPLF